MLIVARGSRGGGGGGVIFIVARGNPGPPPPPHLLMTALNNIVLLLINNIVVIILSLTLTKHCEASGKGLKIKFLKNHVNPDACTVTCKWRKMNNWHSKKKMSHGLWCHLGWGANMAKITVKCMGFWPTWKCYNAITKRWISNICHYFK